MSRYTAYGVDAKWGKILVSYGTDHALGDWYDVIRIAPELEIGKTVLGIDIETDFGYVITDGAMRSIKTFDGEHWFERGEKALFETDQPFDFVFKSDEEPDFNEKEPTYFPASNHIWLSRSEIWEGFPIVDRCTRFDKLTRAELIEVLAGYGIAVDTLNI